VNLWSLLSCLNLILSLQVRIRIRVGVKVRVRVGIRGRGTVSVRVRGAVKLTNLLKFDIIITDIQMFRRFFYHYSNPNPNFTVTLTLTSTLTPSLTLTLTDIQMPVLDGFEASKEMRENERLNHEDPKVIIGFRVKVRVRVRDRVRISASTEEKCYSEP
jgi:DNA-binding NarL/FixJ family response regulator